VIVGGNDDGHIKENTHTSICSERENQSYGLWEDSARRRGFPAITAYHLCRMSEGKGQSLDDILEMPELRETEQYQPAHEMSILRTWNVREAVDETPTPLVAPESLPDMPEPRMEQLVPEALIRSYDWDDETALRIARCESGYRPDAVSWDGTSFGVMQLYAPIWAGVFPEFWSKWDSAEWNVATAYQIYLRAGRSFSPWSCW